MLAPPLLGRLGIQQHLADGGQPGRVEEHVLRAAEADALCTHHDGLPRVCGRVGIRHHPQPPDRVGPPQQFSGLRQVLQPRVHSGQLADVHLSQRPVNADSVALFERVAIAAHLPEFHINLHSLATDDARLPQPARHHRRMAGDSAPAGDHAIRCDDAVDVVRFRLGAHQNDLLAPAGQVFGHVGVEADPPRRGSR